MPDVSRPDTGWVRRIMRLTNGVAATVMWLSVPIVAHDAIFTNIESLQLLMKVDR